MMVEQQIPFHPIADVFPLMSGDAFKALVADIRTHGLLEPIVTHEGHILDGRNRYRACAEAGVTPTMRPWNGEGGTPAQLVWSKNAERRQLTASQKAMAAQAMMPFLEAEAKERLHEGQGRGRDSRWSGANSHQTIERPSTPLPGNPGKAAEEAARLAGVGSRLIYEAKELAKKAETNPHAAELVEQVRQGEKTVYRAMQEAGIGRASRQPGYVPPKSRAQKPKPEAPALPRPLADITRQVEEEAETLRRHSRSPLTRIGEIEPPDEDADEAIKSMYQARPARAMISQLISARLYMAAQKLTVTDDAIEAWWRGVDLHEWEQTQEAVAWLEVNAERIIKFVHFKTARGSVPPHASKRT